MGRRACPFPQEGKEKSLRLFLKKEECLRQLFYLHYLSINFLPQYGQYVKCTVFRGLS